MKKLLLKIRKWLKGDAAKGQMNLYFSRFSTHAFTDLKCRNAVQYEASITRLYHTIEKGLSYENYRAGFGKSNVEKLLTSMEQYAAKFDTTAFFYETALSCLNAYIEKNKVHGHEDPALEQRIQALPGTANGLGGVVSVSKPDEKALASQDLEDLLRSRHSIRHFSQEPVDMEALKKAIALAQFTPSACNRQGWRTRIIADKNVLETVLKNQNGNAGFGQEFDKLLVITADLRCFQRGRELFQAFIDGGMYAENVLNGLYRACIGAVPLSAALTPEQEANVRRAISMHDAEVFILMVGIGNYPAGEFLTTRSERHPADIIVI